VERKRRGGEVRAPRLEAPKKAPDLLAALQASLEQHARHGRASTGAAGGNGTRARDGLSELTVEELAERARKLGIAGRSKMTKRQLVSAIAKAER